MSAEVTVRVVVGHQHVGDTPGYHEWVSEGRFKGNSRGRRNPRVTFARWTKWICNNTNCHAWAVVSDAAIQRLIDEATP